MELFLYCLYPFIIIWLLLEWVYKTLRNFFYWLSDVREPGAQRERNENINDDRPPAGERQGEKIEYPERIRQDKGMNPKERTLPYIIQEEKPEPEKKRQPKPKRERHKPVLIDLTPETKGKRRQGIDDGRGGR